MEIQMVFIGKLDEWRIFFFIAKQCEIMTNSSSTPPFDSFQSYFCYPKNVTALSVERIPNILLDSWWVSSEANAYDETYGGQLYPYCCIMPCRSGQISFNSAYFLPKIWSIPRMNILLSPINAFPSLVNQQQP